MLGLIAANWWLFLLRGVFAILFGVIAFAQPAIALASLVFLWGIYVLIDGVASLVFAFKANSPDENRWLIGLQGVIGIVAGVLTFVYPIVTGLALLMFIAIWSIAIGALQIAAAIQLRKEIKGEFWLGLSGFMSIIFAMLIVARPGEGALALIYIIAIYAILFGIAMIAFAFRLKGVKAPTSLA